MELSTKKGFVVAVIESSFVASLLTIGASISVGFKLQILLFLIVIALCAAFCLYALAINVLRRKIFHDETERLSVTYVVAVTSGIWMFWFMIMGREIIFSILASFLFWLFIYIVTDKFNRNVFEKQENQKAER